MWTGSVWSGDIREGFNGGAEFVRWVRSASNAEEAVRHFAAHCDRVRVMPFLDGGPCSIHGSCSRSHRRLPPVEMVTLRRGRGTGAGSSTFADRELGPNVGQLIATP